MAIVMLGLGKVEAILTVLHLNDSSNYDKGFLFSLILPYHV